MASKKPGPYAPLSANYADDDRIMAAGEDAELLYLRMLAYAARVPRMEGWISDAQILSRLGILPRPDPGSPTGYAPGSDPGSRAERLADVGLIERDGDGYRITSWLKWNESAEQMDRRRTQDRYRKNPTTSTKTGNDTGSDTGNEAAPGPDSADQKQKQNQKQNPSSTKKVAAPRATQLPDDWKPTEKHAAIAAERGIDLHAEAEKFRDWCGATGRTYKDHDLAFNGWLRRADPPRGQQRPNRDAASRDALIQAHFDMQMGATP